MWRLSMAERGKAWTTIGEFETVTAVAQKLIELEGYPVSGVFFELLVDTKTGTDKEAFQHLEHTGKRTGNSFAVKWIQH